MKHLICLLMVIGLCSCQSRQEPSSEVIAQIGSYVITQEEFDEAYKESSYAAQNNPGSRKAFLGHMIEQKLILQDAQNKGLDKQREFLKMVESFWQQSLVTVALKEKSQEGANLDQWLDYLKKNTKIDINEEYLK